MRFIPNFGVLRISIITMMLMTVLLVGLGRSAIQTSNQHQSHISLANHQRVLLQRMHGSLLQMTLPRSTAPASAPLQKQLTEAANQFNTVLKGFAAGYAGPDGLGDTVELPPLKKQPELASVLARSEQLWQTYYPLVQAVGSSQTVSPQAIDQAFQFSDQRTDELLGMIDEITMFMVQHNHDELQRLRWLQRAVAAMVLMLGVIALVVKHKGKLLENQELQRLEAESQFLDSELLQTRQQLRDLMVVSPDLVWSKDENGVYLSCNRSYEVFKGRAADSLTGRNEIDLYEAQQTQAERTRDEKLMAEGQSIHTEVRLTSAANAQVGLFEIVRTPLRRADGGRAGVQTVARDITLRRQTEVQLVAMHERLRLFEKCVASLNDAVLITEAEPRQPPGPRIVFVNDAFTHMTGYTQDEVLGMTPRILQGPRTDRGVLDRIHQTLENWQSGRFEVVNYAKDGREFWVELVISPIADGSNGDWYTHWVSVQREITQRKQSESEIAQLYDRALESSRLNSQFLSVVDREVRTPINGIADMAQKLAQTTLTLQQQEYASAVAQSAQDLAVIVNDILDLSKLAAGRLSIEIEAFALQPMVQACMARLQSKAQRKHLQLLLELDPALPQTVLGDANRVRQVLFNLLDNALNFTGAGSVQLALRVVQDGAGVQWLRFEVRDTGVGLSAAAQTHLFLSAHPIHGLAPETAHSVGLGLALCKQLVTLMQGSIGVSSEEGRGSTFWFELALATPAAAPTLNID